MLAGANAAAGASQYTLELVINPLSNPRSRKRRPVAWLALKGGEPGVLTVNSALRFVTGALLDAAR